MRRLCFYRCLSVHGGGCLPQCMLGYHTHTPGSQTPLPLGADPPRADTPLGADTPPESRHLPERRPLLRMVRILLECILVQIYFYNYLTMHKHLNTNKRLSRNDSRGNSLLQPQPVYGYRIWGKVIFLHLSVCSQGGRGSTYRGSAQHPPGREKRAVRILLECYLVNHCY